jgi:hypothetical protein
VFCPRVSTSTINPKDQYQDPGASSKVEQSLSESQASIMSRPSSICQRPLTLTEELEKLEQSITLTLQGKQTMAVHQLPSF